MTAPGSTPTVPTLLHQAGLAWRWAEPADLLRIVSDWFADGKEDFFEGRACPFPALAKVINDALLTWKAGREGSESARRLLVTIYDREKHSAIRRALEKHPPLVVYSVSAPSMVAGWGHPDFERGLYLRPSLRGFGLEDEMRAALGSA
jgi:hypothetical protein